MKLKLSIKIRDEHNPKKIVLRDGEEPGVLFTEEINLPYFDSQYMTSEQKEYLKQELEGFIGKYIEAKYEEVKNEEDKKNSKQWDN